jgi:transcription elongation factor GreA
MVGKVIFMTPEGLKKLEEELEYLSTVKRYEVARQIHEAMDEGDEADDNVAYEVAKNEQAFLEGRIREIEEKLARSRLVEMTGPADVAQIGSTVVLRDELGNEETFRIVGPTEANPRAGLISYESPMGTALLNQKVGCDILVNAPGGIFSYKLLRVG